MGGAGFLETKHLRVLKPRPRCSCWSLRFRYGHFSSHVRSGEMPSMSQNSSGRYLDYFWRLIILSNEARTYCSILNINPAIPSAVKSPPLGYAEFSISSPLFRTFPERTGRSQHLRQARTSLRPLPKALTFARQARRAPALNRQIRMFTGIQLLEIVPRFLDIVPATRSTPSSHQQSWFAKIASRFLTTRSGPSTIPWSKLRIRVMRRDHYSCRACDKNGDEITLIYFIHQWVADAMLVL